MTIDPEAPFDVVVTFRNHPEWLEMCLQSIELQKEPIRSVSVYDDASDEDMEIVFRKPESGIRFIRKEARTAPLESLKAFHDSCPGDGITVWIGGDDYLYGPGALGHVRALYRKAETVATYGGWYVVPDGVRVPTERIPREAFPRRWAWSNMLTWRQELFADARSEFPEAYQPWDPAIPPGFCPASDVAVFAPMARVAFDRGMRVRPCFETVYCWRSHDGNDQVMRREAQVLEERRVFALLNAVRVPS